MVMLQRFSVCTKSGFKTGDRKTFERLHQQLCETGSFLASRSDSGCAKTNERIALEEAILDMMVDQPSTSTRVIAKQLHAS